MIYYALLPCPFCGGQGELVEEGEFYYRFKVKCKKCGASTGGSAYKNDKYNSECWNRREAK